MPGEVAFQVGREVAFHAGMTRGEVAFEEVASRGVTRGGVCGAVASRANPERAKRAKTYVEDDDDDEGDDDDDE